MVTINLQNILQNIDLQTISIIIGFALTIVTLLIKIKQDRFSKLIIFSDKINELRTQTSKIHPYEDYASYKAQSLLKQQMNLYELISYSIFKNLIKEKDALNLLEDDMNYFYEKNKNMIESDSSIIYFSRLIRKWSKKEKNKYIKLLIISLLLGAIGITIFLLIIS